ncbi:MAG TPA: uroporphyrinogen-III synthase [Burkholderiaceae bacterium]|nr:uroporphyrinogen-III synthase [Burkholderiaceae bacterium]
MAAARTLVVTRPGPEGQELVAALRHAGEDAVCWPAFDLQPRPAGDVALQDLAARLADFDLAVFVSPAAARAAASSLARLRAVPLLAAVGAGTRAAVAASLGVDPDRVVAPPEGGAGAEDLYAMLAPRLGAWRRVLVVRAQSGRDWLAQRLAEDGVHVEQVAVYWRRPHAADPLLARELVERAGRGGVAATIVTSSEAVAVLEDHWQRLVGVTEWLHRGVGVAIHERIAQRLVAAGFARVVRSPPLAASILATLGDVPEWTAAAAS